MFLDKYKNLGKIFLILIAVYFICSFSIKNIFLADSPKIRPDLGNYLLAKITNVKEGIVAKLNFNFFLPKNNFVADQNKNGSIEFLKNNLKPITKGVSAAERGGYSYTEFKLNEIEWAQITYTLKNGQTITVEYPKGTNPPPKAIYDKEYE